MRGPRIIRLDSWDSLFAVLDTAQSSWDTYEERIRLRETRQRRESSISRRYRRMARGMEAGQ